jgi:hypothetical protein
VSFPLYEFAVMRTVLGAMLVSGLALALIGPQLLLYSQQGIFEGKYQDAAAIGVAVWTIVERQAKLPVDVNENCRLRCGAEGGLREMGTGER